MRIVLLICFIGSINAKARAEEGTKEKAEAERTTAEEKSPPIGSRKVPLDALINRSVGIVKRPAVLDWRASPIIVSLQVGQPVEYNNFDATQFNLDLRFPGASFSYRLGLSNVRVKDTKASLQLAQGPYFQSGRPSHIELQNALETPLIEGIGSQLWSWMPTTQFVLSGVLQLNSAIYGNGLSGFKNLKNIQFNDDELEQQKSHAPEGMRISRFRHDIAFGLQWDNYYRTRVFWNFRALGHKSIAAAPEDLKGWLSFSLGAGYVF